MCYFNKSFRYVIVLFSVSIYDSGSVNSNMHGPFAVVRGSFTTSQWIELEHQALIYKYISSNVPVPSHLLIPIKKALYPYGFSSGSFLPTNSSKLVQMHNWLLSTILLSTSVHVFK